MKLKIHISIIPHNAYFNYRHTTLNLSNLQDIFDISQKKRGFGTYARNLSLP